MNIARCPWVSTDPIYEKYHDFEWGIPVFDDKILFEFLILEGAQAGLSWITILKKRENYRKNLDNFDPLKISQYDENKMGKLLKCDGIIRHKLKINSIKTNAIAFLKIQKKFGSFSNFLWKFVNFKPIQNNWKRIEDVPKRTELSDKLAKELKEFGFSFVGTKTCYSFMQAIGLVNDHLANCDFSSKK